MFLSDNTVGFGINTKKVEGINLPYGEDLFSRELLNKLREIFNYNIYYLLVPTGTFANSLILTSLASQYGVIFCSKIAHIIDWECNAPQAFNPGVKVCQLDTSQEGKISVKSISKQIELYNKMNSKFCGVPSVVTITNPTEVGTLYKIEEIKEISNYCKINQLSLHIDGARLMYANEVYKKSINYHTTDCGIDGVSFGLTKSGSICGELAVFFNEKSYLIAKHKQKQLGGNFSKQSFFANDILCKLVSGQYSQVARKGIEVAKKIEQKISCDGLKILYPVETNQIFLEVYNKEIIKKLENSSLIFYKWPNLDNKYIVRLICHNEIYDRDINRIIKILSI
jgi:threonine aldolase